MAKRTAKTSGWVAQKAGDISIRVAESIVRRVGPRQGFGAQLQEGGQRRRDAAQEIAAASLVAAVEIYSSMEGAAQLVLQSGSQAASDIAGHKCALFYDRRPPVYEPEQPLVFCDAIPPWVQAFMNTHSMAIPSCKCMEPRVSIMIVLASSLASCEAG